MLMFCLQLVALSPRKLIIIVALTQKREKSDLFSTSAFLQKSQLIVHFFLSFLFVQLRHLNELDVETAPLMLFTCSCDKHTDKLGSMYACNATE